MQRFLCMDSSRYFFAKPRYKVFALTRLVALFYESPSQLFSIIFLCRDYLALNVYVALCYYKLDYYDVSQEVLAVYLQHYSDSAIALNLKACNHFRLYNGKAAEVGYDLAWYSIEAGG